MANESTPDNPLPVDFVPEGAVATHTVSVMAKIGLPSRRNIT